MAPGHARLILLREMIVLEHVRRRFLVFRSRYQPSAVERLGRRRHRGTIPFQSTSVGGRTLPQSSQKEQYGNKLAPSNRRPLADNPVRRSSNRTREGAT